QLNFSNRWLYYDPSGLQIRFGFKVVGDNRLGGQMTYNRTDNKGWGSLIDNRLYNGYLKAGLPLRDDQSQSIAFVATFNHYGSDASFGYDTYSGRQDNVFANLLYHNDINDSHSFEVGLTALTDFSTEDYRVRPAPEVSATVALPYMGRREVEVGPMAEYTWHGGEAMTLVAGVRADYNTCYRKLLFAPRATFRYNVTDDLILRLSAGRAFHSPHLLADNYGLFTSSRANRHIKIDVPELLPEDAVTFGGNLTWYLPFGYENNTYVSAEYFGSRFLNQLYVDKEMADGGCYIYNTQGSKVFTNTFQLDFSSDLTEHFNLLATLRYTNPKVSRRVTCEPDASTQLVTVPMSSLFKAVVNAQYKTNLSKWTFDATAQLNGPMRLPDYAAREWGMEQSPVYPMFYAQVTRKFRGLDVYAGVENISGYRQKDAIIAAENPFSNDFDATVIWGPLMGRKAYIGLRYTLWK
ncbi:MAG: TonB-dependent receptor, partial [Bacteroidales bacterium]|nr:TonB-dependent receptor [Bacteroidales bacterium]